MDARYGFVRNPFTALVLLGLFITISPKTIMVANATSTPNVGGFLLPWAGDRNLSQGPHEGGAIDIPGDFSILAPKDGVIVDYKDEMYSLYDYGCDLQFQGMNYLILGHGPLRNGNYNHYSVYWHIKRHSVQDLGLVVGERVRTGQAIGYTGNTGYVEPSEGGDGTHLHFYVTRIRPTLWVTDDTTELNHCRDVNDPTQPNNSTTHRSVPVNYASEKIIYGFEETGNIWPPPDDLPASYNQVGGLEHSSYCDPTKVATKVILYNHIDYGGECIVVSQPDLGFNIPIWIDDGWSMHVSSLFMNPIWLFLHTLTLWDDYSQTGNSRIISTSYPDLNTIGWNDRTKSVHNALIQSGADWLLEQSYSAQEPLEVDIHIRVADQGDFDAFRVCFDGQNCQETAATELYYTWNTFGWADGNHIISIQYRRDSHGGNWDNSDLYETSYYLSATRTGVAPCDGGDGAELTSVSDCIRLFQSFEFLDHIGWSDRSNLQVKINGPYEALIYDGAHFEGPARLVIGGETQNVGGNVSSILLRTPTGIPPLPYEPFASDINTTYLLHFDEGSGNSVSSTVGSLVGSFNGVASWVSGKFGQAVFAPNPPDGSGIGFGTQSLPSPFSVEAWVKFNSIGGDQRIMTQLGGGSNSGYNKWCH